MPPLRRSMRRTARRTSRRQNMMYQENEAPVEESADSRGSQSYSDEIEELSRLKNEGMITEDEYNAKKKQILGL